MAQMTHQLHNSHLSFLNMDKNTISSVNKYIYFLVTKVNTVKSNFIQCAINYKFGVVGGMTELTWELGLFIRIHGITPWCAGKVAQEVRRRALIFCSVC